MVYRLGVELTVSSRMIAFTPGFRVNSALRVASLTESVMFYPPTPLFQSLDVPTEPVYFRRRTSASLVAKQCVEWLAEW